MREEKAKEGGGERREGKDFRVGKEKGGGDRKDKGKMEGEEGGNNNGAGERKGTEGRGVKQKQKNPEKRHN